MTINVQVSLTGVQDLNRRLKAFEEDLRKRILVESMKKCLDKALIEAQAKAPRGDEPPWGTKVKASVLDGPIRGSPGGTYKGKLHPGYLQRSFRIAKIRKPRGPGVLEVQLQNTAYTARWVEWGHRIVKGGTYKSGRGKVVGFQPANHFMLNTFNSQKNYMVNEVFTSIQRRLKRAEKKVP